MVDSKPEISGSVYGQSDKPITETDLNRLKDALEGPLPSDPTHLHFLFDLLVARGLCSQTGDWSPLENFPSYPNMRPELGEQIDKIAQKTPLPPRVSQDRVYANLARPGELAPGEMGS